MLTANPGFLPPATPIAASAAAATIRMAHLGGSLDRHELPGGSRVVVDQDGVECCVSCALASAMEIRRPDWPQLSPLFHYYAARVDRRAGDNAGRLTLLDGLETLSVAGICERAKHDAPMSQPGAATPPSQAAYVDARGRRLPNSGLFRGYEPIGSASRIVTIRHRLRRNRPVLLGFRLPRAYPDTFLDRRLQWDDPTLPSAGAGHCVLVFGYDDMRLALRVQDSRGSDRFGGGCWWMGYAVADSAVVLVAYSLG